jgi:hypothetical protein
MISCYRYAAQLAALSGVHAFWDHHETIRLLQGYLSDYRKGAEFRIGHGRQIASALARVALRSTIGRILRAGLISFKSTRYRAALRLQAPHYTSTLAEVSSFVGRKIAVRS